MQIPVFPRLTSEDARRAYLSEFSLEERTRLRVRQTLKRAQIHLLAMESSMESLKVLNKTPLDEHRDETVGAIDEILSLASKSYFDQVKDDITSGPMSNEEKEAFLSMLGRFTEQGDIWKSSIETLSETKIMALSEQVSTLSEVPMVPGPNVMHLEDKFLDLSGQFILMGHQLNTIRSKSGQCISKLQDVDEKMNSNRVSVVESLAAVNEVYTRSLPGLLNHEWATELWHTIVDGYEDLKDLNPEAFRQAFFDLVGSTSPPSESV